jgi:hypothetical protein
LGEEIKQAVDACAVVTNEVPQRSRSPLQDRAPPRTPRPWDYPPQDAHTVVDPSDSEKLLQSTLIVNTKIW